MTSVVRLYAVAAALLLLFGGWAAIAANPFPTPAPDPRLEALAQRELRLRRQSAQVQRVVDRRWEHHRIRLAERKLAIARIEAINARRSAAARAAASATVSATAPASAAAPVVRLAPMAPVTASRSS